PATTAEISYPWGVAIDGQGNLFIADAGNGRIRKLSTDGTITTVAGNGTRGYGGDGGPATSASFNIPKAVVVDSQGNLFIVDTDNNRIRKVSANGTITTVAGNGTQAYGGDGGPATSASLDYPEGIALDGLGDLFIADTANHRVRKIGADGTINTVAGNGTEAYGGDGGPARTASLDTPKGLAVDSQG